MDKNAAPVLFGIQRKPQLAQRPKPIILKDIYDDYKEPFIFQIPKPLYPEDTLTVELGNNVESFVKSDMENNTLVLSPTRKT